MKRDAQPEQDMGRQQSVPGIEVSGDFAELAQMTERVRKSEKRWSIIGKALGICALFFMGRMGFYMISPILEGEMTVLYLILNVVIIVLVSCGAVSCFLEMAIPRVKEKRIWRKRIWISYPLGISKHCFRLWDRSPALQ